MGWHARHATCSMVVTKADNGPQNKTCFNAAATRRLERGLPSRTRFERNDAPFWLTGKEAASKENKNKHNKTTMKIRIEITFDKGARLKERLRQWRQALDRAAAGIASLNAAESGSREIKLHDDQWHRCTAERPGGRAADVTSTGPAANRQPTARQPPANRLACRDAKNVSDEQAHRFLVHHPAI